MIAGPRISSSLTCRLNLSLLAVLTFGIAGAPRLAAQTVPTEGQPKPSAELYLGNSYRYYQLGRFADSIEAARAALKQRWNYAAAWNNIAASYDAMGLFEDGIRAAQEALKLEPGSEQAAANLAWGGRGLMNAGLEMMAKGDSSGALDLFHRAEAVLPNYYILEINLGIANGELHNSAEAERHFLRAIQLAPVAPEPAFFYARWLRQNGRLPEAVRNLRIAVGQHPDHLDSLYLLMQSDADLVAVDDLRATAQHTLARFPADSVATDWLAKIPNLRPSPESYLNLSLVEYQAGRYTECIAAAKKALELRPGYSEAWNNIAAASNAMSRWTDGVQAAEQAVRLNPDNQLAKNNLALAKTEQAKQKAATGR
jgi:tetratricopeptide (TPR) repeat protein